MLDEDWIKTLNATPYRINSNQCSVCLQYFNTFITMDGKLSCSEIRYHLGHASDRKHQELYKYIQYVIIYRIFHQIFNKCFK